MPSVKLFFPIGKIICFKLFKYNEQSAGRMFLRLVCAVVTWITVETCRKCKDGAV